MKNLLLNILFQCAHRTRRIVWMVFRPTTIGVKMLLLHGDSVMLVKTRYSKCLSLPGGKVNKLETPRKAAMRELREETGITVSDCRLGGVYSNFTEYKSDTIVLFSAETSETGCAPGWEIEKCGFYPLNALPPETSPATRRRIEEFKAGEIIDRLW
ncbi:MAG: NUDIX domain-containing protein [Victivallaceae bacterium]